LIYIHKRDVERKRFEQLGEYCWNGVTMEDLLIDISKDYNIPTEYLVFATYELYYDRWVIFYDGTSEPGRIARYLVEKEKEIEEAKKTKKKARVKRLHIKDGTVACIKDMRDDPFNSDGFALSQEAAQIFIEQTSDGESSGGKKK